MRLTLSPAPKDRHPRGRKDAHSPVWDDRPWHPLPALDGTVEADVCVVGLGGSGLATIHELLDLGVTVVGLEKDRVGGGATGRNGGFFLAGTPDFHHRAVAELGATRAEALYRLTLEQIDRMWLETPAAVRVTGSLRLAVDEAEVEDCRRQLAAMEAAKLPVETYAGAEGHGLLFPRDACGDPLRRARTLAGRARMRGARLYEGSPGTSVNPHQVDSPRGAVRCQTIIVAVDGNLSRAVPEITTVRTARAQMLATGPAYEVTIPRPVYARWGYDYWQQLPDKRIVLGGFRDLAGDREWSSDAVPTPTVQRNLEAFLREGLGVRAAITHRWAGTIGFTPTKLPVIWRGNGWAFGGYSGTGNVLGAVCGRAVAQWVVTGGSILDGILDVTGPDA
jgi:glycine/D-amino acid oxidase-like deaminating enzyme